MTDKKINSEIKLIAGKIKEIVPNDTLEKIKIDLKKAEEKVLAFISEILNRIIELYFDSKEVSIVIDQNNRELISRKVIKEMKKIYC